MFIICQIYLLFYLGCAKGIAVFIRSADTTLPNFLFQYNLLILHFIIHVFTGINEHNYSDNKNWNTCKE